MIVGWLYTPPLENQITGETGYFHLEVTVNDFEFSQSGDKAGLVKHRIAQNLASAIMSQNIPKEYWMCDVEPLLAKEIGIPVFLPFGIEAVNKRPAGEDWREGFTPVILKPEDIK